MVRMRRAGFDVATVTRCSQKRGQCGGNRAKSPATARQTFGADNRKEPPRRKDRPEFGKGNRAGRPRTWRAWRAWRLGGLILESMAARPLSDPRFPKAAPRAPGRAPAQ